MKKLAISAFATLAAASVWAIPGTITPESGSPVKGDITWKGAAKIYSVEYKRNGAVASAQFAPKDVASLDIDKPAGLDKAIEQVRGGQGGVAIPLLSKIVTDYKMLVWDKVAARYLVLAQLAVGKAKEAEKTAQLILADDKNAAFSGEFAPSYWQVLLQLGDMQKLENNLKKAIATGDRAASAEALNMRGDIILKQGNDSPDAYNRALVDAYLRVALMYLDEPCREARLNALQKAAQCFDRLGQAVRAEDMRARAKAI